MQGARRPTPRRLPRAPRHCTARSCARPVVADPPRHEVEAVRRDFAQKFERAVRDDRPHEAGRRLAAFRVRGVAELGDVGKERRKDRAAVAPHRPAEAGLPREERLELGRGVRDGRVGDATDKAQEDREKALGDREALRMIQDEAFPEEKQPDGDRASRFVERLLGFDGFVDGGHIGDRHVQKCLEDGDGDEVADLRPKIDDGER
jgi:hypothetical protein